VQQRKEALILDGVGLQLEAILLDGRALTSDQYELTDLHLQIHELPSHCVVTTICIVNPDANTALESIQMPIPLWRDCIAQVASIALSVKPKVFARSHLVFGST